MGCRTIGAVGIVKKEGRTSMKQGENTEWFEGGTGSAEELYAQTTNMGLAARNYFIM
jgi:hypothetical protein